MSYVYEAQNMLFWGMGLMLGLAALAGFLWLCWRIWKRDAGPWLVVLSWVVVYGVITGGFYVKYMRYMLPIYPFLTLMAASILIALLKFSRERVKDARTKSYIAIIPPYAAIMVVLVGTMFQGLALLNVYSQPNTRIQASRWIFSHLKPGSVLTYEQWDDSFPVAGDYHDPYIFLDAASLYSNVQTQQGLVLDCSYSPATTLPAA